MSTYQDRDPDGVKLPIKIDTAARADYAERRNPSYATYGPKTRREFFNLLRSGAA